MSPFTLHCKADIHNPSSSPRMPFQQTLSSHSLFLIPWGTSANNSSKAKVFHIMKVESKSISYHAFSLSFSLSLFWDKEKESNQPALGINLPIWNPFLIAYLALLSSTHLHHLMLPLRLPHLPGEQMM
ncbi:hypothetical protein COP2_048053 [Malus domestica]